VSFAKFLFLPSWFAKLLETNLSCFAKIIWMPSWFAKLLELLLSMLHSSVSEEVEEHKHIFFLKVPDASFQEVEGHKHNFVSLSRLLM
jgi:hypothetical protein